MIKAVVFDLDDTLISEDEYIKSGYRAVAQHLFERYKNSYDGLKNSSPREIEKQLYRIYENKSNRVFNEFLDNYQIAYEKQDILELVSVYRNHTPEISFYPDVKNCMRTLKERGISIGVISDGYLETQTRKAEVLGLQEMAEKIIFTESLGREYWKPHKYSFQLMKNYFKITYEEMMYIGDNPQKDFYVKKEIPITTLRIIREKGVYEEKEYREGIREDYRIYSLEEIFEII